MTVHSAKRARAPNLIERCRRFLRTDRIAIRVCARADRVGSDEFSGRGPFDELNSNERDPSRHSPPQTHTKESTMSHTMVTYTVKPGREEENAALVRAVFEELAETR